MVDPPTPSSRDCADEYARILAAARTADVRINDLETIGGPNGPGYRTVVPVLLVQLQEARCPQNYSWLLHLIINAIARRECGREALPVLIEEYQRADLPRSQGSAEGPPMFTRARVANGIGRLLRPADAADVMPLAQDTSYGYARAGILEALSKLRRPDLTLPVLAAALDDDSPAVVASALVALRRMKAIGLRGRVEPLVDHENAWVRKEAAAALRAFDRAADG